MGSEVSSGAFLFCLVFVGPIAIAKFPLGASWYAVLMAYAILFGILALFGLTTFLGTGKVDESFGWPLIFAIFVTLPGIPILVVVLKLLGVR